MSRVPPEVRAAIAALPRVAYPRRWLSSTPYAAVGAGRSELLDEALRIIDAHDASADAGIPIGLQGVLPRLTVDDTAPGFDASVFDP